MKKIALALVAMTVAAPAFAQDEAEPTFTGAHVSGVVGYDKLQLNTPGLENPDGVVYGINFGYDAEVGSVVLGIEGEATDSTGKIEVANVEIASAARDLYVGGRLGFTAGSSLLYVKGGYTNARFESIAGNENGDGWRLGAGAEMRFGSKFFGKVEYRYSNYEGDVERHQAVLGLGVRF